jgi:peptidylprolyl isomerase
MSKSWYAAGMPPRLPRPTLALAVASFACAVLTGPMAASQPIEPLGRARPAAPPAPPDVADVPADATRTESGLAFKVLAKGRGTTHPGPRDKVTINFTGWTPFGALIESSIPDGEPWTLSMTDAMKGLAEGVRLMVKGERRRLWIPAALAAGGQPKRRGPAGPAVFDVELVGFVRVPDPVAVPEDVDAPPADAKKTASGIAYKFLKRGTGKQRPTADSTVEVHYSGWTPDGKMFDSSVQRGQPTSFPLGNVIKGWTEGVQLMVVGDKARFWIPGALAYGDKPARPGTPAGPLVFDIELLGIR